MCQLLADFDTKMGARVQSLKALRNNMQSAFADNLDNTGLTSYLRCCDFNGGEYSSAFFTQVPPCCGWMWWSHARLLSQHTPQISKVSNCVRFPPSGRNAADFYPDLRASSGLITTQQENDDASASLRWQVRRWCVFAADSGVVAPLIMFPLLCSPQYFGSYVCLVRTMLCIPPIASRGRHPH